MSARRHKGTEAVNRKVSVGGWVFIALALYGIFFLIYGITHMSHTLSAIGVGDKFWWIAKGLSIIILFFIALRSVKKYRGRNKGKNEAVTTTEKQVIKSDGPPLFSPLLYGLMFSGIPVLLGLVLIAYTIAPNLIRVPNMAMLPIGITALYFAMRSAVKRSRAGSATKKEADPNLVSARDISRNVMLVLWLIGLPGYYAYYAPGTLPKLIQTSELSGPAKAFVEYEDKKEREGPSVDLRDLPQNTLLDPGLATGDVKNWEVIVNIVNPHMVVPGDPYGKLSLAIQKAADGTRQKLVAGSSMGDHVFLAVEIVSGNEQDRIILHDGDCKPPHVYPNGTFTTKTCSGNWSTGSNSVRGVYGLIFDRAGRYFSADLYEGNFIKNAPDIKLIVQRKLQ